MSEAVAADRSVLEKHHIDVVDPADRRGRARDLFSVWFSANLNIGGAVFGALAVALGNNVFWSLVVVVLGNVLGGTFMALHSVQGARLGVPQLIQSRGQFGFYGALLPVVLAALLYAGFFTLTAVISGQALAAAAPAVSVNQGVLVSVAISLLLALLGYRAIHLTAKWAVWPLAAAVVVVTVVTAVTVAREGVVLTVSGFAPGPFFGALGIIATFLLTYAPYVSDYSRYLPVDTPARAAFTATFAGAVLASVWSELLGVFLAAQVVGTDTFQAVGEVLGGGALAAVVLLVTAAAIAGNNALNLYGSMLNLITAASSFRTFRPSVGLRIAMLLPTLLLGTFLALQASADFYAQVGNFLSFLTLGFVPWGAINLLDFYLVRRGEYDVRGFFDRRGRYYRDPATWTFAGFNVPALVAYAVGVAAAVPFVANGWYTGPAAAALGDADLSWIPGLLVSSAVYLVLVRLCTSRTAGRGYAGDPSRSPAPPSVRAGHSR
ncbi:purine-cytosine permease family protein [Geodermatophilus sp. SYSU D00814]